MLCMQEHFEGGITNGNDWYPVYNGMQDWLYVARGCRALTLELWETKWPQAHLLDVRRPPCMRTPNTSTLTPCISSGLRCPGLQSGA